MNRAVYLPPHHTQKDWAAAMNSFCKCGHPFYHHSFTMHSSWIDPTVTVLWSSQCVFCPYDREKDEFTCKGFDAK